MTIKLGELATILERGVVEFRSSQAGTSLLTSMLGHRITPEASAKILGAALELCKSGYSDEIHVGILGRLEIWAPDALVRIHRNSHMNDADGRNTICNETFDALLVDFINYAVMPMDLAMYTSDLPQRVLVESLAPTLAEPAPIDHSESPSLGGTQVTG